jgi:hypothetical protein
MVGQLLGQIKWVERATFRCPSRFSHRGVTGACRGVVLRFDQRTGKTTGGIQRRAEPRRVHAEFTGGSGLLVAPLRRSPPCSSRWLRALPVERRRWVRREPAVVEPVDPLERGVLHFIAALPRATATDELGLVEADDRLGEGVAVRVALGSDRVRRSWLTQALGVADREVLPAPVAVMDRSVGIAASPDGHLQRVQSKVGSQRPRSSPPDDRPE